MLNNVQLIGNLGCDPETRFTVKGKNVCTLSLATTEKWKDQDDNKHSHTEWHRVILWGKLGEIAQKYNKKGSKVYIEGKLRTNKWTDNNGNDRYTTEIIANKLILLGDSNHKSTNMPASEEPPISKPTTGTQQQVSNVPTIPTDTDVPF